MPYDWHASTSRTTYSYFEADAEYIYVRLNFFQFLPKYSIRSNKKNSVSLLISLNLQIKKNPFDPTHTLHKIIRTL